MLKDREECSPSKLEEISEIFSSYDAGNCSGFVTRLQFKKAIIDAGIRIVDWNYSKAMDVRKEGRTIDSNTHDANEMTKQIEKRSIQRRQESRDAGKHFLNDCGAIHAQKQDALIKILNATKSESPSLDNVNKRHSECTDLDASKDSSEESHSPTGVQRAPEGAAKSRSSIDIKSKTEDNASRKIVSF